MRRSLDHRLQQTESMLLDRLSVVLPRFRAIDTSWGRENMQDIEDSVRWVMREDQLNTVIRAELWQLAREGLLEVGCTGDGQAYFWPTPLGCRVLGMEMDETPEEDVSA